MSVRSLHKLQDNFLLKWMRGALIPRKGSSSILPSSQSIMSTKSSEGRGSYLDGMQFPHCDAKVLHRPGLCKYCDGHPDWQQLRVTWGINFTDYDQDPNLLPDPATQDRSIQNINRWGGNYPSRPDPTVLSGPR